MPPEELTLLSDQMKNIKNLRDQTVLALVTAGATMLDARLPCWRGVIDEESLDLQDGMSCILGQIFGRYSHGLNVMGLTREDAVLYGFTVEDSNRMYDNEFLTQVWSHYLNA